MDVRSIRAALALSCVSLCSISAAFAAKAKTMISDAEAVLGTPTAARDFGTPLALASDQEEAVGRVLTDPGQLPLLKIAVDGKTLDLPLRHTQVFAEVSGFVARVQVVQTYENPFDEAIEAIYVFPLPENSAVDDMQMRIGERVVKAEIQQRDRARQTYEQAKAAGHTAALLEQQRPNVFAQSVANIAPKETIEVQLRYVQLLSYDGGEYEFVFPMVVGPRFMPGRPLAGQVGEGWAKDTDEVPDASRISPPVIGGGYRTGHDIHVEVHIDAGMPVRELDAPTHDVRNDEDDDGFAQVALADHESIPNRDFVLRYRVDGEAPSTGWLVHRDERGGFFTLVLQPPTLDVEALVGRREMVFVVDVSGSMNGVPLAMCKAAMRDAIQRLRPVDTFNVMTFAGHQTRLFEAARPANTAHVEAALKFIEAARAGGGTYMADAVATALDGGGSPDRRRYVFFLTDGYVGNETAIFDTAERFAAARGRLGHKAAVFTYGVGSSVNRHLIDGLAKAGRGIALYVTPSEDPLRGVGQLYRAIDHAVLEDLEIDWGGLPVVDVEPANLHDLYASRPLIVQGRYEGSASGEITLKGRRDGRPFELTVPVDLPRSTPDRGALATLWARRRIEGLERTLWGRFDQGAVDAITNLGLEYRIVTPYTSFVAVDRSRVVGDGKPVKVVQPVEVPAGVDIASAAPLIGLAGPLVNVFGDQTGFDSKVDSVMSGVGDGLTVVHGAGGMGLRGTGRGGGGSGYGMGRGHGKARSASVRSSVASLGVVVSGSLDRDVVLRVLRRRARSLRSAYEKALKRSPNLAGRLEVKIVIGANGRVKKVEIMTDTMGDETVTREIARLIDKWRFPKPAGGGEVSITLPLVFSAR